MLVVAVFTTWVAWPFLTTHGWVTGYDTVTYGGPNLATTLRELEAGRLPVWNEDLFAGVPHLANPQAAVLYPLKWLFVGVDAARAYELITALHLYLLAGGMLVLLSARLRLRPPAGAVGAVALVGSGLVMARSLQFEQLAVLAWVPWVLAGIDAVVTTRHRRWRAVALTALAIGVLLVAGHPQQVYVSAPVIAVWTLARVLDATRTDVAEGWRTRTRAVAARLVPVAAAGLLGLALAAAQVLPAVALLPESALVGTRDLEASIDPAFSVTPRYLASTLLGDALGTAQAQTADSFEAMGFVGGAAALLALVGVVATVATRRWRWTGLALAGLVVTGLVFALGPECRHLEDGTYVCEPGGLPYRAAYRLLPGFGLARVPGRWMAVATFALAIAAALGVDALRRRAVTKQVLVATGALLAGFLVAAVATGSLPPGIDATAVWGWTLAAAAVGAGALAITRGSGRTLLLAGAAVLVLAVGLELGLAQRHSAARTSELDTPFTRLDGPAADFLAAQPDRILSIAGQPFDDLAYLSRALKPNANATFGVRSLDGYDGGVQVTNTWINAMEPFNPDFLAKDLPLNWQIEYPVNKQLLARFGVRYVLIDPVELGYGFGLPEVDSERSKARARRTALPGWTGPLVTDGTIEVFENPAWKGDAVVYHETVVVPDTDDAVLLQLGAVKPWQTIVTEGGPALDCPACTVTVPEVRRPRPGVIEASVTTTRDGVLVVPEQHLPGWSVTVDGEPADLLEADGLSLGVFLPPGEHEVRFAYDAPGLRAGTVVSLLAGATVVALLVWPWGRRRRARPAAGAPETPPAMTSGATPR